jgi:hypothetical protein
MKKLILACTAPWVVVAVFAVPSAQALPVCLKWTNFCGGIQLDTHNWPNNAVLYDYDCLGNNSLASAAIRRSPAFTNNCPGGQGANRGLVWGEAPREPGHFYLVLDSPHDGTMDMHLGSYPEGICVDEDVEYTIQIGECQGINGARRSVFQ